MQSRFVPLDLQHWPRREIFHYFTKVTASVSYTATMRLDVSPMREALRRGGIRFFPSCLYLVTKAIADQPELRLALQEGTLGIWDYLCPQYPVFHPEDTTFTFLWTDYDEDFGIFYRRVLSDQREYGQDHGIFSKKGMPPENSYLHASIPWLAFDAFSFHLSENGEYFAPIVETGKLVRESGREWLPVSLTVNHATADGWHVSRFFEQLQEDICHPNRWLCETTGQRNTDHDTFSTGNFKRLC